MGNVHQYYLKHIADKTGYRATWEPNKPLTLGAIVKINKGVFAILSSLEKEGIPFEVLEDSSEGTLDYSSSETVQIGIKAAGQIPAAGSVLSAADAGFSIDFGSDKSILFQADKTKTHQINNIASIEREVIKRVGEGRWDKNWLIVTELLEADTATIIVSFSTNSKIEIKANANVGASQLKLTDASLELSVVSEKGSLFKAVASKGITPLYRVMGYHHPLFGKGQLKTRSLEGPPAEQFGVQEFDPAELEDNLN